MLLLSYILPALLIAAAAPADDVRKGEVVNKYKAVGVSTQRPYFREVWIVVVYDPRTGQRGEWQVSEDAYGAIVPGTTLSRTVECE